MTWAAQALKLRAQCLPNFAHEPAVVPTLGVEDRASQRRNRLAELELCGSKRSLRRALQGEHPEERAVPRQGNGAYRPCTMVTDEGFVRPRHTKRRLRSRRICHGRRLIQGLIHGIFQGAGQISFLPKIGTMRNGLEPHLLPLDKTETHPITGQPLRHSRDKRHGRGLGSGIFEERRQQGQYRLRLLLCGTLVGLLLPL